MHWCISPHSSEFVFTVFWKLRLKKKYYRKIMNYSPCQISGLRYCTKYFILPGRLQNYLLISYVITLFERLFVCVKNLGTNITEHLVTISESDGFIIQPVSVFIAKRKRHVNRDRWISMKLVLKVAITISRRS